jgi:phage terminase large subunit GpA-like protein
MAERINATLDMTPQGAWLDDINVSRNWRQPRRMSVSEWADEHRVLDPLFAAEPGPWRTNRAPYVREIMDSCNLPWVRRCTWLASTQVGKSEWMNNVLGFYIHQKPSPSMVVMPNRDAARMASERRIMPMVRASDALTDEMTDRSHDVKARELVFKRSVCYMRSAQSPTDLASVPVRLLLGDEVDKWPHWAGNESSPLSLATERTRTYHDHVIAIASTCTNRDGVIFREHALGDQRKFHVPCPHCQEFQVLEWPQVKWDSANVRTGNQMRERRDAWYECCKCAEKITDHHKREMLRAGEWVPEGHTIKEWLETGREADRAEHRSYHLWAAYSPWVTYWKIAAQFLDAKDEPALLMNFTNSWLAEIWEERVTTTSDEAIAACVDVDRESYEVPDNVLVITAAVDVQLDYMVWQVAGWAKDERSVVIAMGRCDTFEQLSTELNRPWGEQKLMPRCIVVDSRYRRDEVMDFCRVNAPVVKMIAGVERTTPIPFSTTRIDKHPKTGQVLPNSMTVWTVNVGLFKDLVAHRFRLSLETENRESVVGLLRLPNDLEPHWIEQLSSEHKVVERTGKRQVRRWVMKPGRKRNEAWDVTVYNAAAAKLIRVDTLRSDDRMPNRPNTEERKDPRRAKKRPPSTGPARWQW